MTGDRIRVGVLGATGRVGRIICAAVAATDDLELATAVGSTGSGAIEGVAVQPDPQAFLAGGCDVVVDFSTSATSAAAVPMLAAAGVHVAVGTSGLDDEAVERIRAATADGGNVIIVPNFAISAVLMQRFAELAAPHFQRVEIIEYHHDAKVDAPSGLAVATATRIAAASDNWDPDPTTHETIPGARGAAGGGGEIPIHAVRMRGMNAHQDVIFGAEGQTLTLRQDSYDRSSYVPGVLLAVRRIAEFPGLTLGLDPLL